MKILKKIAAILIVAVTMVSFISCNKDDKEASANTNAPASVADTNWEWYAPDATDVYRVQVEFNGPMLVSVIKEAMVDGIMDIQCYLGNYTYSNGSGSLSLEDDNHAPINASFTIDGTRMSLTLQGGSYTLTKK
jgi:hypothetical protein